MADQHEFLYPRSRYYGKVKPENLVFNANLQEFAQQVSYICNLETAGKLSPDEAYEKMKTPLRWIKGIKAKKATVRKKSNIRFYESLFTLAIAPLLLDNAIASSQSLNLNTVN